MSNEYRLSPRKAWICRVGGALFLIAAALVGTTILVSGAMPEAADLCKSGYCEMNVGPLDLLPTDVGTQVTASPAARAAFDDYLRRPIVRLGSMGVVASGSGPFAALLFCVGIALRRLGGRSDGALARALPWLRRASIAAIVWAMLRPLSDSLNIMLLFPGTPAGAHWHFVLDVQSIGQGLMLGVAAYATVWALEAGLQAQRDLAEIV